jgi:UDP-3-O-[3-hydroxymyristoyl] glucosamine N-acyltransferase
VGADSRLHPSVVVYAGCRLGQRAIVHSGAVIGADGFGMALDAGRWLKVPQIGRVLIGDDVEIGANTTIDRGTVDDTVIEDGVKLDNQVQIGHNCRIGAHTAMAGCAGVAGSAHIGQRCTLGGAAVVLGHLSLCDDVHVSAATVITRSIRKPGTYTGLYPFDENASWARNAALLRHLDELGARPGARAQRGTQRKKRNG